MGDSSILEDTFSTSFDSADHSKLLFPVPPGTEILPQAITPRTAVIRDLKETFAARAALSAPSPPKPPLLSSPPSSPPLSHSQIEDHPTDLFPPEREVESSSAIPSPPKSPPSPPPPPSPPLSRSQYEDYPTDLFSPERVVETYSAIPSPPKPPPSSPPLSRSQDEDHPSDLFSPERVVETYPAIPSPPKPPPSSPPLSRGQIDDYPNEEVETSPAITVTTIRGRALSELTIKPSPSPPRRYSPPSQEITTEQEVDVEIGQRFLLGDESPPKIEEDEFEQGSSGSVEHDAADDTIQSMYASYGLDPSPSPSPMKPSHFSSPSSVEDNFQPDEEDDTISTMYASYLAVSPSPATSASMPPLRSQSIIESRSDHAIMDELQPSSDVLRGRSSPLERERVFSPPEVEKRTSSESLLVSPTVPSYKGKERARESISRGEARDEHSPDRDQVSTGGSRKVPFGFRHSFRGRAIDIDKSRGPSRRTSVVDIFTNPFSAGPARSEVDLRTPGSAAFLSPDADEGMSSSIEPISAGGRRSSTLRPLRLVSTLLNYFPPILSMVSFVLVVNAVFRDRINF